MRLRLGLLYGILVALLLVMGLWWVYFLTSEGGKHAAYEKQKLSSDRLHATFLIQSDTRIAAEPQRWLADSFPDLDFVLRDHGVDVTIRPEVLRAIDDEARHTRNMFLYEGLFFLVLLVAGSMILVYSWRTEARFKQARELFLAGATHEFKTPLASLRLYTETLGRDGLSGNDQAGIRKRMVQDISRLEELVNDVLSLSAADTYTPGRKDRLDLVGEIEKVLHEVRRFTNDLGADIRLEGPPGCLVYGQRLTLALAVRNLVMNAVKHSPAPVRVRIRVQPGPKWHQIVIEDDGPGIPRRLHKKVFECFYSGTGKGQTSGGSGLGLFLVKRNIEALGGKVELDSEEGSGCVFTIELPAVQ